MPQRKKAHVTVDVIIDELERIRAENSDNRLIPREVVEESKPKDAPLHSEFEWRNNVAGQKYREWQARALIKRVVITNPETKVKERKYINVTKAKVQNSYYQNAEELTSSEMELAVDALDRKIIGIQRTVAQLRRLAEESGDDRLQAIIAIQSAMATAAGLAESLH